MSMQGNVATDAGEKTVDKGFLSELCGRQIGAGAVDEKRVIARTESERSLQIGKPEKDRPEPVTTPAVAAEPRRAGCLDRIAVVPKPGE